MIDAVFFEKGLEHKDWPKIQSERGGVIYTNARKKRFQNSIPSSSVTKTPCM
jgi:hypothetical protein